MADVRSPGDAVRLDPVRLDAADEVVACSVLHADLDSFFASVEVLDDPDLRGKPVIVGGSGNRGVVASCTYEARAYGVHSAMSSVEARRRCPRAIFVSGRYWRYAEVSEKFHAILKDFTPLVEGIGLDEAFLDVRGVIRLLGLPPVVASSIRDRVKEELQIDCSVGVARTKLLAKLGSRAAKPTASLTGVVVGRGVYVIMPSEERDFLQPLPVRALWGVGPATARRLEQVGVSTVGALTDVPEATLCRLLGSTSGRHLAALARGEDDRVVEADRDVKSVSHEETFPEDLRDRAEMHRHVLRMSDGVGARLAEAGLSGRTVNVKIRFADRQTISRSHTAGGPLRAAHAIAAVAQALVDATELPQGVRLIGVAVSGLCRTNEPEVHQLSLPMTDESAGADIEGPGAGSSSHHRSRGAAGRQPAVGGGGGGAGGGGGGVGGGGAVGVDDPAWRLVEDAVSAIRARYGQSSVGPAALVGPDGLDAKRRGDRHWGPDAEEVRSAP
jgi:DNA polymerase IV